MNTPYPVDEVNDPHPVRQYPRGAALIAQLVVVLLPGVAACWGVFEAGLLEGVEDGRYAMLGTLLSGCLVSQMLAWMMWRKRIGSSALALGGGLYWVAQLVHYVGLGEVSVALLLILGAQAAGSLLNRRPDGSLLDRFVPGMAVLVSIVAWLLPFPVHDGRIYLLLLLVLIAIRWTQLRADGGQLLATFRCLGRDNPYALALVVMTCGFASMGLWLPSLNYDDNAVHIALQTQLLHDGYYRFDIASQVWAMSPWFNNVWHALAAMLLGAESRAAGNLVWLVLGACGAWRLAGALGAGATARLLAAAVYASNPMVPYFGTTLQVDGPSTAVLLHLAAVLVSPGMGLKVSAWTVGSLIGMLLALKVTNVVYLLLPCLYITFMAFRQRHVEQWAAVVGVSILTGCSSYVYAWLLTGNPTFPLFNTVFHSPYYPLVAFEDARWHVGAGPSLVWDITFSTQLYMEAQPGAMGVTLLALLGGMVLALLQGKRTFSIALASLLPAAVLFGEVQYARYIFPSLAVLTVLAVVALDRLPKEHFRWIGAILVMVCATNVILASNTSWITRSGAWEGLVQQGPAYGAALRRQAIAPQILLERMKSRYPQSCALNSDAGQPFTARMVGSAVSAAWYDQQLQRATAWSDSDMSGQRWVQTLQSLGVSHVLRPTGGSTALEQALRLLDAGLEDQEGALELWRLGTEAGRVGQCSGSFFDARDTAHRNFHWNEAHEH